VTANGGGIMSVALVPCSRLDGPTVDVVVAVLVVSFVVFVVEII
jgi:hypothetical protein